MKKLGLRTFGQLPRLARLRRFARSSHFFGAEGLQVTLKSRLKVLAPRLTPRAVLENFATLQMIDVHLPTTDGRTLILTRHTELEQDHQILLQRLKLTLPRQPPPRITSAALRQPA